MEGGGWEEGEGGRRMGGRGGEEGEEGRRMGGRDGKDEYIILPVHFGE